MTATDTTEDRDSSATPPTLTELASGIMADAQQLLKQQISLFRAEFAEDLRRTRRVAQSFGVGIFLLVFGAVLLVIAGVHTLEYFTGMPAWASWAICGLATFLAGIVAMLIGSRILTSYNPLPDKSFNAIQENLSCLSESPEMIELQMGETRDSLTQKISALEDQVVDTLHNATTTVSGLLDSAKNAVPDTIAGVKEAVSEQVNTTFNFTQHTKDKPWAMVGGAAALGFITGMWLFRRSAMAPVQKRYRARPYIKRQLPPHRLQHPSRLPLRRAAPIRLPGWLDQIIDKLTAKVSEEVRKLGEMAVETVSTSLQHTLESSVPKLLDSTVSSKPANSYSENGVHSRM